MKKKSSENIVWMDLEMTGLDPDCELIIEIATIVTDGQLNILEEGPCLVIHQSNEILTRMDEWNTTHHKASGLIQRVKESTMNEAVAEQITLEFIKKHCIKFKSPLAGNSIAQDRRFLAKYMKNLNGYLHYRNIDVTTIKELVRRWHPTGPKFPKKSQAHLASIDVRESLQELEFYRKHYFTSEVAPLLTSEQS
jgi:oligoribonuclease